MLCYPVQCFHSNSYLSVPDVERQKLKAIGQRFKLQQGTASKDSLRREEADLHSRIQAKEREMKEFESYLISLEAAEGEQLKRLKEVKILGRGN